MKTPTRMKLTKSEKVVITIILGAVVVLISAWVVLTVSIRAVSKEIESKGLKTCLEEIWNGKPKEVTP